MADELVYLFTGDQEIFIQNRINRIINGLSKKTFTINKYDMESTPISTILEDALTFPFLEDLKILILRNPTILKQKEINQKEFDGFIKYLKNPSETTILIIDACNIQINEENPLFKTLKMNSFIIDYSGDEEAELKGWIVRGCEQRNITIDEDALELFLEYINEDQVRMVNELDKIIEYVNDNGHITTNEIKLLVSKDLSKEVFKLIEAIINKDFTTVHSIYEELSVQTKDIGSIIFLITENMKNLLQILRLSQKGYSQQEIAKMFGISSGRAYYLIKDAEKFNRKDLESAVIKLCDLDYNIKSGKIDKNIGLELLLLKL